MEEEYKIIKGFENYEVSNIGNVRNIKTGKILKPGIDSHGYYRLSLYYINGNEYKKLIHKLIAEYFIENPYNKKCVDHIDNDRLNNNINNLRWVSYQENNMNRKLSSKNSSNFKGVYFHKPSNKWCAHIQIRGKNIIWDFLIILKMLSIVELRKPKNYLANI